jgi:hypothetical protein
VSKGAREAIEKAGGTVVELPVNEPKRAKKRAKKAPLSEATKPKEAAETVDDSEQSGEAPDEPEADQNTEDE